MMADVGPDNVMEEVRINEAEVTVDSGGGTTGEGPGAVGVVREGTIGMLEEGDCNFEKIRISKVPDKETIGVISRHRLL